MQWDADKNGDTLGTINYAGGNNPNDNNENKHAAVGDVDDDAKLMMAMTITPTVLIMTR